MLNIIVNNPFFVSASDRTDVVTFICSSNKYKMSIVMMFVGPFITSILLVQGNSGMYKLVLWLKSMTDVVSKCRFFICDLFTANSFKRFLQSSPTNATHDILCTCNRGLAIFLWTIGYL